MDIQEKLNFYADQFSTNKATNKAYHRIFELIYKKNIIDKENNEYGYAEIHSSLFKAISKRKYNEILQDLYKNNLIFTNIPLNIGHTLGAKSVSGSKIIRGYKIDRTLDCNLNSNSIINSNINSNSNYFNSLINSLIQFNIQFNSLPSLYINKGEHFLKRNGDYNILKVYEYIDIDRDNIPYNENSKEWNNLAKKWNRHTKAYKNGNRIYSWFHSIHGNERNIFMINGSNLRECFDVPACNFCLIAKMLEKQEVDEDELIKFQNMIKTDYIYGCIAKSMNLNIKNSIIKKNIKASCQHWLNIRKRYKHTGSKTDKYFNAIDTYFKNEFPSIYNALINWREAEHNGKITKMLWFDFQEMEYEIMSKKICTYLYKTYNVFPITVHDAIYLSDNDIEKVQESIEDIFWKELDLKYI